LRDSPAELAVCFDQLVQQGFDVSGREVARIQLEDAGLAEESARDEVVALEASDSLLHDRERGLQEAGKLPRIALLEQAEGNENSGACARAKRR